MKKFLVIFAVILFSLTSYSQNNALKPGTTVYVKLMDVVSSDNLSGQVNAVVDLDVLDENGATLISAGTPVEIVVEKKKSGMIGRAGKINISYVGTTAADGQKITLTGNYKKEGKSRAGLSLGITGCGCFILPPFNFLALLIKGGAVEIPANSKLDGATVQTNYTINKIY